MRKNKLLIIAFTTIATILAITNFGCQSNVIDNTKYIYIDSTGDTNNIPKELSVFSIRGINLNSDTNALRAATYNDSIIVGTQNDTLTWSVTGYNPEYNLIYDFATAYIIRGKIVKIATGWYFIDSVHDGYSDISLDYASSILNIPVESLDSSKVYEHVRGSDIDRVGGISFVNITGTPPYRFCVANEFGSKPVFITRIP